MEIKFDFHYPDRPSESAIKQFPNKDKMKKWIVKILDQLDEVIVIVHIHGNPAIAALKNKNEFLMVNEPAEIEKVIRSITT